jgi:transmembrane sensor
MTPAEGDFQKRCGKETPHADKALRWLQTARAEEELLCEVARNVRRRRQRRRAWAGGTLAALALAALGISGLSQRTDTAGAALRLAASAVAPDAGPSRTATISAPHRETLPDGSIVELKSGAAIAHDYTPERRSVTLLRGEAHFQVAKNPQRPFIVTAGAVAVRAVGTAFSVQFAPTEVEVLVTEGRVAVEKTAAVVEPAPVSATVDTSAFLQAGGRAVIRLAEQAAEPEVSVVPEAELAKRLAWRVPQLEFSRTPLTEIVALMNQHGGAARRIVLDGSSAEFADVKLSGFLAADNDEGLARLLEANFPIVVTQDAEVVRLSRVRR